MTITNVPHGLFSILWRQKFWPWCICVALASLTTAGGYQSLSLNMAGTLNHRLGIARLSG